MAEIKKLEKNSTYLKVLWSDGEESKFNYLWLRDNCPTAHDKDSNHRMFNILNVSKEINPKNYNINKDGKLEIEWSEGNHTSYFDLNWLRDNCYTIKNKKKYISPYKLWDNSLKDDFKSICVEHDEIMESTDGLIKWLELLHHTGIAIVKNAPDRYAKSTTAGQNYAIDNTDGYAIVNRKLINDIIPDVKINTKGSAIPERSAHLTTLASLYQMTKSLLDEKTDIVFEHQQIQPSSELVEEPVVFLNFLIKVLLELSIEL